MLDLTKTLESGIGGEFEGAVLGDVRRSRRLCLIAERAAEAPAVGFPRMVADDSELEGVYRFFNNEEIKPQDVLEPHIQASLGRMQQVTGPVLVVHDTTDLRFGGRRARKGLGMTHGKQQGFLLHLALAVLPGEERLTLGVCGSLQICRTKHKNTRSKSWHQMSKDPTRESLRWGELVDQVEDRGGGIERIHLMDREGDNYDLFALMLRRNSRFVVRACHDRALIDGDKLFDTLKNFTPRIFRDIEVNERPDHGEAKTSKHPPRTQRSARVAIEAGKVEIRQTPTAQALEKHLSLNVVRVWEPSPPDGEPPVSWMLYTTEPIETEQQLLAIVDYYRSRWIIEEFFKSLKTGCSIEKRQLESYHGLSVALALFLPIAWRLLLMRSVSRMMPDAPATTIVTDVQLKLLCHRLELTEVPQTAEAVAYAVAKLAGHLKRNGPPGWHLLGQGFEMLVLMEAGWRAAVGLAEIQRSDQS